MSAVIGDLIRPQSASGHRFGWKPDAPTPFAAMFAPSIEALGALPAEVRLDETDAMPAPYDQGQLGSCTANGLSGAFEFDLRLQGLTDFMPSRLFVYYNERAMEGTVGEDSGAQIHDGVTTLLKLGVCSEADLPYDVNAFTDKPSADDYSKALSNKVTSASKVAMNTAHWKASLAANKPVVFGFTVYESFEQIGSDGIMPMPTRNESVLGGHCVVAVGYANVNGKPYWRVRNSWGASWADGGYLWMPEAFPFAGFASDAWNLNAVS